MSTLTISPAKPGRALTAQQELFIQEYLVDFNATAAARRAGYTPNNPSVRAGQLMRHPNIGARVRQLAAERIAALEDKQGALIAELFHIATADANELSELRRGACRHCHGAGFGYQRTKREMTRDRVEHAKAVYRFEEMLAPPAGVQHPGPFDEQGGEGYDPRQEPNAACPECFGEGVAAVHLHDTRELTPAGRALYAGIKTTKDGIEVKTHSKEKAIELLSKIWGMVTDKVEVSGQLDIAQRIVAARRRAGP